MEGKLTCFNIFQKVQEISVFFHFILRQRSWLFKGRESKLAKTGPYSCTISIQLNVLSTEAAKPTPFEYKPTTPV